MEKKKNSKALDVLKEYLQRMAATDSLFAEKFNNKEKSIEDCLEYIKSEARKEACNGSAMIEDSVVFGWAAHYYQEDSIKPNHGSVKCDVSISSQEEKKSKAPEQKKPRVIELDLFGGSLL